MKRLQKEGASPLKNAPPKDPTAQNGSIAERFAQACAIAAVLRQIRARRRQRQILIFFGWKREAERLFREFWQTGRLKPLCAFVVHVIGMRARLISDERRAQ